MSSWALGPNLGPLSNREAEYQIQNVLLTDKDGRLRFSPFVRQIFIHCLPTHEFVTPDLTTAPLILCGICRRWREVALSTPKLWTSLHVHFTAYEMVDFCQLWLSRAQGAPLSLSLEDDYWYTSSASAASTELLLTSIVGLSQQWQKVALSIGGDLVNSILPLQGTFPLLEKFSISVLPDSDPQICFRDAPKLRNVSVHRYYSQIQLPWHQLTTFRVDDIDISCCLEILRNSLNLLNGTFNIWGDSSALPIFILHHTHLECLTLGTADEGEPLIPISLLNFLQIPTLTSLTLDFRNYASNVVDISPILRFLSRSIAQLQTLVISCMGATTENLIECLKVTPSLVHLELEYARHRPVDMDAIFTQLTELSDFLPKLESLRTVFPHYNESDPPCLTASIFVQMLCWRWAAVGIAQLRSFRLGYCCNPPPFDEPRTVQSEFERLEAEGMELYFGKR
ncbi:hypothetical protein B0H13DRAFT_1936834 [Mycena leptocephala]|nr:hypothetical protein B0H13DRAFT_1936834 [Mycena leptocephala]